MVMSLPLPNAVSSRLPDGPAGHFLHGNTAEYMRGRLAFLERMARTYGDVVLYRLGCDSTLLINDPALCRLVLGDWEHVDNALTTGWLFLDQSYLAVQGRERTRPRRIVHASMCPERVLSRHAEMSQCVERLVENWQVGDVRDAMGDMMRVGVEMISEALLGRDVHSWAQGTFALLSDIQVLGGAYTTSPAVQERLTFARRQGVFEAMVQVVADLVRSLPPNPEDNAPAIGLLMRMRSEGSLTDMGLIHEVCVLLLSSGSSAILALNVLYVLSSYPEVREKLEAEMAAVLAGRAPVPAELPKLPYLELVLKETLRLYPPVGLIPRQVVKDFECGGYTIPAGSQIHMSPHLLHRHPAHWDDPERFWPERFETSAVSRRALQDGAFLPFGSGIRRCIGDQLASIQVKLLIATTLQRVRLDIAPGYVPAYDVSPMGACYPSSIEVPMVVTERHARPELRRPEAP